MRKKHLVLIWKAKKAAEKRLSAEVAQPRTAQHGEALASYRKGGRPFRMFQCACWPSAVNGDRWLYQIIAFQYCFYPKPALQMNAQCF